MDRRLRAIAAQIDDGKGFIDVGTDHGYIPAALAASGYAGNIYASDVNPMPLEAARATAAASGVAERIGFLLCDGLDLCPADKIDTVVIAGMGGDLICRILDRAGWCFDSRYKLILQPMTKSEILRYWLVNNGFSISQEDLAQDGEQLYQIIIARFGGRTELSDGELFAGKYALASDKSLYLRRLDKLTARFERALSGMERSCDASAPRLGLTRGILKDLKEMRQCHDKCK